MAKSKKEADEIFDQFKREIGTVQVRPQGFTTGWAYDEVAVGAYNFIGSTLTINPATINLPWPCKLKWIAISAKITPSGGGLRVQDPNKLRIDVTDGISPGTRNPGFDVMKPYSSSGVYQTGWVDGNTFSMNGQDNYTDLSEMGLVYNQLFFVVAGEASGVLNDHIYIEAFFRLERVASLSLGRH